MSVGSFHISFLTFSGCLKVKVKANIKKAKTEKATQFLLHENVDIFDTKNLHLDHLIT